MGMRLGQMQQHAAQHRRAAHQHRDPPAPIAQRHSRQRPEERRQREHRAGAGGTEAALRQQVEAQAQPIAGRADRQQCRHRRPRGHRLPRQHREQPRRRGPERRLDHHDLPWITLGQCAGDGVVRPPGNRRHQHGQQPGQAGAPVQALVEHQQHAAAQDQAHRGQHPSVQRFPVQQPRQQRREQRLQRQHQRRARPAGALQTPGQRHRPEHRAERRHQQQARRVAALQLGLALDRLAQHRPEQRRSRVQQTRRGEGAEAAAEVLHQWRAQSEQRRGQQRQHGPAPHRIVAKTVGGCAHLTARCGWRR